MEIKNRLFPYPVLCKDNDDYGNSVFDVSVEKDDELNDIILEFNITLDNREILSLIREGKAEYVIHVECPCTSYRRVTRGYSKNIKYRIPKGKINKDVYLVAMVVATSEINGFYSNSFNEDYDENVYFDKGAIIAYKNLPKMFILKNQEELTRGDSFFSIVNKKFRSDDREPITYDLSGDKIKILVDDILYNEYVKFQTNQSMKPLLLSCLVMPALAYTVEILRNDGYENYVSNYWFQKLSKACELKGKNFIKDIIYNESTAIEVAQNLLESPVSKTLDNLSSIIEDVEE
jgi:hypothetical protein